MIGASAFGRMWRAMMRTSGAPTARAASVKSRSRIDSTVARTMRAVDIQLSRPITRIMTGIADFA